MSCYRKYAVDLDAAFKAARGKYVDAYEAVKAAEKRVEEAKTAKDECFKGDADIYRADCAAALRKAEVVLERHEESLWRAFDDIKDELDQKLRKQIAATKMAVPEDVQENAMRLLESGIMRPDELDALRQRYEDSGNGTMLRIVGQYAENAAEKETDPDARLQLILIAKAARNSLDDVLEAWDGLLECAKVCSGRSREGVKESPSFVVSMAKSWERLTENTIATF